MLHSHVEDTYYIDILKYIYIIYHIDTAQILKSMADDTRLAIIRKLATKTDEVACKEIVNDCSIALQLSQPTMSHHLARLVQTGVVLERKLGKEKFYKLNHELLLSSGINPEKL